MKSFLPQNSYFVKIGKFIFISGRAKILNYSYKYRSRLEGDLLVKEKFDKTILLVYDLKVSPPTYGDAIDFFFLGRVLSAGGFKIQAAIIDDEVRSDWDVFDVTTSEKLKLELIQVANFVLNNAKIEKVTFNQALKLATNQSVYIPFFNQFATRKLGLYKEYCALSEYIGSEYQEQFNRERYLFMGYPNCSINESYIAWHIRADAKWTQWENEGESEIFKNYELIRKQTNHKLVIISSESGCKKIRNYFKNKGIVIAVSKDFGKSFLDDMALVLGSKVYIQMGWGGMFVVAGYSAVPYGICVDKIQETWELQKFSIKKQAKLKPWASKYQKIWKKSEFREQTLQEVFSEIKNYS